MRVRISFTRRPDRTCEPHLSELDWLRRGPDGRKALQRFSDDGGPDLLRNPHRAALRMQGFFKEFAIDMIKADGQPLQMIANANERRDPDGKPAIDSLRAHQGDRPAALRTGASGSPRNRESRREGGRGKTSA